MKSYLLSAMLLLSLHSLAQAVFLRSGVIQPEANIRKTAIDSFNVNTKRFSNQAFCVLQFQHIPTTTERGILDKAGIVLLDYLADNTYTVSIKGDVSLPALQALKAKALFQLLPKQKMADYFANGVIPSWAVQVPGTVDVWVAFPKTLEAADVVKALAAASVDVLSTQYVTYHILVLRIAANRINEIASLPYIEYIQPAPPKAQPLNYNSRTGSAGNLLNASVADGGKGLNGEGVVIGIGDNSDLQGNIDFQGRVINRNALPFVDHGLHVAGTAAGAGNVQEEYRGYAPKATIVSQAYEGIIFNAPQYVQDYGMVITNNSYANIVSCSYDGTYDLYSRLIDQQAFDLPNLLNLFAAGNSGFSTCSPYSLGFHRVAGGYQTAKNVITVGSTRDSGLISHTSSRGPVKDGRIKPDLVNMGFGVMSDNMNNTYGLAAGTSMATPGVAGGAALLYQRYRQVNSGANPKNGLIKAALCNGARDRGPVGPDFYYGYGWMNLLRSLEIIDSARFFINNSVNGGTTTHSIAVPANTARVKILLYWNDLPASIISAKSLVNDLDLEVVDPSATTLLPQILDTAMANLPNAATIGVDHVNNMEQIVINNPAAGNYAIHIKGTTVTNAQQEYYVVYDVEPAGLLVTSPSGGEPLVPAEDTKISWETVGLAGMANLEFSDNGGATWTAFPASVDVNRKTYTWNVPNVATNNALIRITDNTSGKIAVSHTFTILGQPLVSLSTVQCEGYASLIWNTIANATDYEVMQLSGSEMKPVAFVTDTVYTFSALSKDSVYWFTVRARIGGKAGRRAKAISRQPSTGTCSGTISDNDLKIDAILSPKTGRMFTSTQLSATETVSVRIKNLDDAPVTGFTVSYAINGVWISENIVASIAAGTTYVHNFATLANLSAVGNYTLQVAVSNNTTDLVTANDSAICIVKQLDNQPINLTTDFIDNIEAATASEYVADTLGLNGIDRYDFSKTTPYGRIRTFINTGIAYSGNKALTLDMSRYDPAGNVSYLYGTFNLSSYTTANDIRLDFQYLNHGQQLNTNNRVWIRGSDTQPWIEAFKLDSAQADPGNYKNSGSIELSNLLSANGQAFTGSFGVRWGQAGQFQAADRENAAGYTFDNIHVYQVFNDAQMKSIDTPLVNSCGLSSTTQVRVIVRNPGNATVSNVPVSFSVNGLTIATEIIPSIPANTSIPYTFTATADLSAFGSLAIQAIVNLSGDSFHDNDTISVVVHNAPVITSFPYLQNFESGDGNFYTGGRKSTWQYGIPASFKINGAASGAKAWKTSLTGTYNDNELSYLYSPCFDVTGLTAPTLSFSVAMDLEDCGTSLCDGAWVEYSADGINWTKLGSSGTGTNWYNKAATQQLWSKEDYTYWHVATQPLPTGLTRLRFRFVIASDPGVHREGLAIDDIHIYDNTKGIYDGVTMAGPVTQTISGNSWIDFTSSGKLVASIQPNNQSLGSTDAQAYIFTGAVRNYNNQYYHNRNITIKPATNPATDSVLVRLYFLDSETELLRTATGCAGCTAPMSAYELGVSKYSDADQTKENGTLADNSTTGWKFIPPAEVVKVPFDKGYYAEFKVADFSELWLSKGSLNTPAPLPIKLLEFKAIKSSTDVLVQWKVSGEDGVVRYEVELAKGNGGSSTNNFIKIGALSSIAGNNGINNYSYVDKEAAKSGVRFYRLKISNADGTVYYSAIQAIVFDGLVQWQVYPNPSTGIFSLLYQFSTNETIIARLYDVKGSLLKEYRNGANGFLQKINIDISGNNYAGGVYLLRVKAGNMEQNFKLYKE